MQNPTPNNLKAAQHQVDLLVEHKLLESDLAERGKTELANILKSL
jgi:ribosomal protein S20